MRSYAESAEASVRRCSTRGCSAELMPDVATTPISSKINSGGAKEMEKTPAKRLFERRTAPPADVWKMVDGPDKKRGREDKQDKNHPSKRQKVA